MLFLYSIKSFKAQCTILFSQRQTNRLGPPTPTHYEWCPLNEGLSLKKGVILLLKKKERKFLRFLTQKWENSLYLEQLF